MTRMHYVLSRSGRVFGVRWLHITSPAITEVETVAMAMHGSVGQPLLYISVTGGDTKPPNDDARRDLLESTNRLSTAVERMYLVLEGTGFRLSMMRSIVAGPMESRQLVEVCASIDEAFRAMRTADGFDERTVRAAFERDGIIGALAERNDGD